MLKKMAAALLISALLAAFFGCSVRAERTGGNFCSAAGFEASVVDKISVQTDSGKHTEITFRRKPLRLSWRN